MNIMIIIAICYVFDPLKYIIFFILKWFKLVKIQDIRNGIEIDVWFLTGQFYG